MSVHNAADLSPTRIADIEEVYERNDCASRKRFHAAAVTRTPDFADREEISSPICLPPFALDALGRDEDALPAWKPSHDGGICIWTFDIRDPELQTSSASMMESLLPEERVKVSRFRNAKDQHHSLMSILMQRALIRKTFQVDDSEYVILRTKENKPYLSLPAREHDRGSWNYNVSHHGQFVCIASHPQQLIGVDIVEKTIRPSWTKGVDEYIQLFTDQFSAQEIATMRSRSNVLTQFFVNWSLKEAFIKAIGTGLHYDLKRIEFVIYYYSESLDEDGDTIGRAELYIDGAKQDCWTFEFCSLDGDHIVSVGTGPIADAASNYAHTFPFDDRNMRIKSSITRDINNVDSRDGQIQQFPFTLTPKITRASLKELASAARLAPPAAVSCTL